MYSVLEVENYIVKLPTWIDSVERVIYPKGAENNNSIEENINYYLDHGQPMSLTDNILHERKTIDYKYFIRNGHLHTSIKNGYIILIYTSIPIDENGDIIIEDEIHLIDAVVWYNVKEYLWQAMVRSPNQYSKLYAYADSQWGYYAINAKTASIFPKNEDALRGLRNKYMKLLPNLKV